MKFEIAKIVRPVALAEYAEEYGDRQILVWVNPPLRLLDEHDQVVGRVREVMRGVLEGPTPSPSLKGRGAQVESAAVGARAWQNEIERAGDDLVRIFAELWSQGAEDTRWSEEEVRQLVAETVDTDPRLWPWLRNQTIMAIRAHRENVKKD
jgi:hypothetical protein